MPVGADLMRAKTCYQQPLTYLESVCCRVKVYQDQGPVLSFPRILSTQAQPGRIRRSGGPWPNHQTRLVSELDRRRAYLTAWRNRIPAGRTKLNHGGRQHQRRKSALAGSHRRVSNAAPGPEALVFLAAIQAGRAEVSIRAEVVTGPTEYGK